MHDWFGDRICCTEPKWIAACETLIGGKGGDEISLCTFRMHRIYSDNIRKVFFAWILSLPNHSNLEEISCQPTTCFQGNVFFYCHNAKESVLFRVHQWQEETHQWKKVVWLLYVHKSAASRGALKKWGINFRKAWHKLKDKCVKNIKNIHFSM